MLSLFTVMMFVSIAVVGGKLRFLSGRPRNFRHCTFHRSFCFLGANYCNPFYDCNNFGSWAEVFAHGGEFPRSFLVSHWFRSVRYYALTDSLHVLKPIGSDCTAFGIDCTTYLCNVSFRYVRVQV